MPAGPASRAEHYLQSSPPNNIQSSHTATPLTHQLENLPVLGELGRQLARAVGDAAVCADSEQKPDRLQPAPLTAPVQRRPSQHTQQRHTFGQLQLGNDREHFS